MRKILNLKRVEPKTAELINHFRTRPLKASKVAFFPHQVVISSCTTLHGFLRSDQWQRVDNLPFCPLIFF